MSSPKSLLFTLQELRSVNFRRRWKIKVGQDRSEIGFGSAFSNSHPFSGLSLWDNIRLAVVDAASALYIKLCLFLSFGVQSSFSSDLNN